jgi:hypothetical protein
MSDESNEPESECVIRRAVRPEVLGRYSVDHDPHAEGDIADYVSGQARDEKVLHVERIKTALVLGEKYEIWDVTTDKNRWWVLTNLTNLYSHRDFANLDYTISFHIGLMARLRESSGRVDADNPGPFDEVARRMDQADEKKNLAVEVEDFQSVGMLLREALIALVGALRRRVTLSDDDERPKDADFTGWSDALMNKLCPGPSNEQLRRHLKNTAKETWQLVQWLTHSHSADQTAADIAFNASSTVIGSFWNVLHRDRVGTNDVCPSCRSRNMRSHFDRSIGNDGDYYISCGECGWTNHPGGKTSEPSDDNSG